MTDTEEHDRPRNSLIVWFVVVASLPAYVLSTGPVCWLINRGYVSNDVMVVYRPLAWLAQHCAPTDDFFEWYLFLWRS